MLRTLTPLAALALVGCAAEPGNNEGYALPGLQDSGFSEGDTGTSVEPEPEPVFQPAAGTWLVVESELTLDQCGLTDLVDRGTPGTTLELRLGGDNFSMEFSGGETVNCTAEETLDFLCEPSSSIDSTAKDNNLNADIPVLIETIGLFEDASNMWMESTVDIDCDGSDCALIELLLGTQFPCQMAMASDLVLQ